MRDKYGRFINGHEVPKEWCEKVRIHNSGKRYSRKTEFKKGQTPWNKGIPLSKKIKQKIRKKMKNRFKGNKNPAWKNGRRITKFGYIMIYKPNHPFANNHKCVFEHRLVMEKHIGRYLKSNEIVHHVNGKNGDNRIANLLLFNNQSKHAKHHWRKIR